MAKRLPAAAVFVQAGPRTAGLAGQQRGRSAALGPTAARALDLSRLSRWLPATARSAQGGGGHPAWLAHEQGRGTGRHRATAQVRRRGNRARTREGAVVAGDEGEDRVMVFLAGEEEERLGKRRTGTDSRKG